MKVKPYCKACDNTFRLEVSATVTIIKQLCSAQDKLKKHMKMCKRNSYCQICVFLLNLLKTHMVMHTTKVLWVTIVKQLCCTGCNHLKKHTWNHTTRKTQCKDCELTYMWEFTRGQNHIEKLSTTVTIVKQLGCTGKENVKTAGSHENAHL